MPREKLMDVGLVGHPKPCARARPHRPLVRSHGDFGCALPLRQQLTEQGSTSVRRKLTAGYLSASGCGSNPLLENLQGGKLSLGW